MLRISLAWYSLAPFLSFPPFQMRSVSLPARIAFELFGPRTNRIASAMLLLPDPFGPVMAVKPSRKGTVIFRPNDLKFSIWISFRNKVSPVWGKVSPGGTCHYPSHLYLSGVRRESDANAEGGDGYKNVAGPSWALTKALRAEKHLDTHAVFGGGKRTSPRTSPRISGGVHTEWASRRTSSALEQGSKTRPSDLHDSVVVRLANMCANARDFHRVGKKFCGERDPGLLA